MPSSPGIIQSSMANCGASALWSTAQASAPSAVTGVSLRMLPAPERLWRFYNVWTGIEAQLKGAKFSAWLYDTV